MKVLLMDSSIVAQGVKDVGYFYPTPVKVYDNKTGNFVGVYWRVSTIFDKYAYVEILAEYCDDLTVTISFREDDGNRRIEPIHIGDTVSIFESPFRLCFDVENGYYFEEIN